MKTYKDFEKKYIGSSDIAVLTLVGSNENEEINAKLLHFGEAGDYAAYIVTGADVEIGKHYKKVLTFNKWLKIYDDDEMILQINVKEIRIYRAGELGCIIQII